MLRSCILGMRIAEQLGLSTQSRFDLFYALLLKDAGCSDNSARLAYLLQTDDRFAKQVLKTLDLAQFSQRARFALRVAARRSGVSARIRRIAWLARQESFQAELITLRCERGALIALDLGLTERTAEAIRSLDERWDGRGFPYGRRGDEIPLLSRIMSLGQAVEVFRASGGRKVAFRMVRQRRSQWFDPQVVDAFESIGPQHSIWATLQEPLNRLEAVVVGIEPRPRAGVRLDVDRVSRVFADIVDAKSPFTARHSTRVATIADGLARVLQVNAREREDLRHAALLHDIGKLALPNSILDKPGSLTPDEWSEVRQHPGHTYRILSRVPLLSGLAACAAAHHERLDGSGYPNGLRAEQLDAMARLLAVSDVFEALTAHRPYRPALEPVDALRLMHGDAGRGLWPEGLRSLEQTL